MTIHYRLTLVYVKRLATITDPFILIFLREAFGRPPCLDYFLVEKLNILVEWGSPPPAGGKCHQLVLFVFEPFPY